MFQNMTVYRNTCCMCCGIPQVSSTYFQKPDKTLVRSTVDHVLLKSLGGSNNDSNLVLMCYDCNQMRGNLFAELDQFISWYWSDMPLPTEKNFSYLKDKPQSKKNKIKIKVKHKPTSVYDSELCGTVMINGFKYNKFKHPLFGMSLVKVNT